MLLYQYFITSISAFSLLSRGGNTGPRDIKDYQHELERRSVSSWTINGWIEKIIQNLRTTKPLKPYDQLKDQDVEMGKAVIQIRRLLSIFYHNPKALSLYDRFLKNELLTEYLVKLTWKMKHHKEGTSLSAEEGKLLWNLSSTVLGIQEALCSVPYNGYCAHKVDEVHESIKKELNNITTIPTSEKDLKNTIFQSQINNIQQLYKKISDNRSIADIDEWIEQFAKRIDPAAGEVKPFDVKSLDMWQNILNYRGTLLKLYPYADHLQFDIKLNDVFERLQKTFMEKVKTTTPLMPKYEIWLLKVAKLLVSIRCELCSPSTKGIHCKPISADLAAKINELREYIKQGEQEIRKDATISREYDQVLRDLNATLKRLSSLTNPSMLTNFKHMVDQYIAK